MKNLKEFIRILDQRGLIAHIHKEVDSDQELAEIHRRVIAAGGPALFFHKIKGSSFPVVSNLFGTQERIDLAFGQRPLQLMKDLVETAQTFFPPNSKKIFHAGKLIPKILKAGIKKKKVLFSSSYVNQNHLNPVDLTKLPFTKSWPEDGGSFLTLPLVYSEDPNGHGHNLGIYRMQRYDENRLGMHWQIAKGSGFHYHESEKRNQSLPITVHLGGPPALLLAAVAPLPENVGELMLAGFLRGKRLPVSQLGSHSLPAVLDSEFALLGEVPPKERHPEGPFGDHYGYYSLKHDYPVFHCKEIWHAKDAVFPVTVVGKPRQEDYFIGEYLQKLLSPIFPLVMPGVIDLWSYGETGFHSLAVAVVKERYPREAMASAFRVLGEGQLSLTKFLLVLDKKLDLKNFSMILEYVLERADFSKDLFIFNHLSMDTLDYTGPEVNKGSKGILLGMGDPVRKILGEFRGELASGIKIAKPFCKGCLVVEGNSYEKEKDLAKEISIHKAFQDWPLIILVDSIDKALSSSTSFLWTTFTRFEPAGDIYAKSEIIKRHHIHYEPPIVIDSRIKPNYPKELFCSEEIKEKVNKRWNEYFPKGMAMGSSDYGNL